MSMGTDAGSSVSPYGSPGSVTPIRQKQHMPVHSRPPRRGGRDTGHNNPYGRPMVGGPGGGGTSNTPAPPSQQPPGSSNPTAAAGISPYTSPLGSIANAYINSFGRGGPINLPTFQELYGSYRDVAERETARQAAQLTETYGSMGARYGSDIGRQQGRLRTDLATNLSEQAANILAGLRQQQFGESEFFSGLQAGGYENAMQRFFADFLRRTGPPPLLQLGTTAPGGFQTPSTVFA